MTTSDSIGPTIPLACVPGAIPQADRAAHFELLARIGSRSRDKREVPDGYAYRFAAGDFDELARWIANERRCCPFLRFTIELEPNGGSVWVHLIGPVGTREFLNTEFPQMSRVQHG